MILTGKAKEDFYNFCQNKGLENFHNKSYALEVCKTFWNALIIDFFYSVDLWEEIFYKEYSKADFEDYKKATEQALIKANEIYNER